jgi:hypothetical protein
MLFGGLPPLTSQNRIAQPSDAPPSWCVRLSKLTRITFPLGCDPAVGELHIPQTTTWLNSKTTAIFFG